MHEPDAALERVVLWKVGLRLLPFLFFMYVVNLLDRSNVSFAKLKMMGDLGLDKDRGEEVYALGAGIFYLGYILFEVPSNFILQRVGARVWMSRIMVSWGLISAATLFVRDAWSFYILRILLGVAEAGFFPGIILYLSQWFPARQRARAVALFMTASPITGVFGSPLSGGLMQYLDGAGGMHGWQWVFLVEGIPSVLLGVAAWFYLTDRPERAAWLSSAEREWLTERLSREADHRAEQHGLSRLSALADVRVCLLIAMYITVAVGSGAIGFYAPSIINDQFVGQGTFFIGLLTMIPHAAAVVGMVLIGLHSDHVGERRWHVAGSAFLSAVGWQLAASANDRWLVMLGLVLAQVGIMGMLPTFWALATSFLSGAAAIGGIALINSVGNVGGFIAPNLMGRLKVATGDFTVGMLVVAVTMFVGAVLTLCVPKPPAAKQA